MLKVRLRNGFSDRNKINPENSEIQYESLDNRSRIGLLNTTRFLYNKFRIADDRQKQSFIKNLYKNVYLQEVDVNQDYSESQAFEIIYETIREDTYDNVLTLIEYISNSLDRFLYYYSNEKPSQDLYNKVFASEYVGYRFANGIIIPITNENEIEEIKQASRTPFSKVNEFLTKASSLLADRQKPDYENSIKESISAVEEVCNILLGSHDSLGANLKKIEATGLNIHPALKGAFLQLFGYTSDASGIRHAGQMDGPSATFEEARFMLVACSAFVNYLLSNYKKAND